MFGDLTYCIYCPRFHLRTALCKGPHVCTAIVCLFTLCVVIANVLYSKRHATKLTPLSYAIHCTAGLNPDKIEPIIKWIEKKTVTVKSMLYSTHPLSFSLLSVNYQFKFITLLMKWPVEAFLALGSTVKGDLTTFSIFSRVAKWNLTSSYDANVSFGTNFLQV